MGNSSKENVAKRVKEALKKHGMKSTRFATYLGVSEKVVSNYLTAKTDIPNETIVKIANILNVDIVWLLTGRGHGIDGWERPVADNTHGFGQIFTISINERFKAIEKRMVEREESCRELLERVVALETRLNNDL